MFKCFTPLIHQLPKFFFCCSFNLYLFLFLCSLILIPYVIFVTSTPLHINVCKQIFFSFFVSLVIGLKDEFLLHFFSFYLYFDFLFILLPISPLFILVLILFDISFSFSFQLRTFLSRFNCLVGSDWLSFSLF